MVSYIENLYHNVGERKINALKQQGKSDIEPKNFADMIESWYAQLVRMISLNPPKERVEAVFVLQDSNQIIKKISYKYMNCDNDNGRFCINICWTEQNMNKM